MTETTKRTWRWEDTGTGHHGFRSQDEEGEFFCVECGGDLPISLADQFPELEARAETAERERDEAVLSATTAWVSRQDERELAVAAEALALRYREALEDLPERFHSALKFRYASNSPEIEEAWRVFVACLPDEQRLALNPSTTTEGQ